MPLDAQEGCYLPVSLIFRTVTPLEHEWFAREAVMISTKQRFRGAHGPESTLKSHAVPLKLTRRALVARRFREKPDDITAADEDSAPAVHPAPPPAPEPPGHEQQRITLSDGSGVSSSEGEGDKAEGLGGGAGAGAARRPAAAWLERARRMGVLPRPPGRGAPAKGLVRTPSSRSGGRGGGDGDPWAGGPSGTGEPSLGGDVGGKPGRRGAARAAAAALRAAAGPLRALLGASASAMAAAGRGAAAALARPVPSEKKGGGAAIEGLERSTTVADNEAVAAPAARTAPPARPGSPAERAASKGGSAETAPASPAEAPDPPPATPGAAGPWPPFTSLLVLPSSLPPRRGALSHLLDGPEDDHHHQQQQEQQPQQHHQHQHPVPPAPVESHTCRTRRAAGRQAAAGAAGAAALPTIAGSAASTGASNLPAPSEGLLRRLGIRRPAPRSPPAAAPPATRRAGAGPEAGPLPPQSTGGAGEVLGELSELARRQGDLAARAGSALLRDPLLLAVRLPAMVRAQAGMWAASAALWRPLEVGATGRGSGRMRRDACAAVDCRIADPGHCCCGWGSLVAWWG